MALITVELTGDRIFGENPGSDQSNLLLSYEMRDCVIESMTVSISPTDPSDGDNVPCDNPDDCADGGDTRPEPNVMILLDTSGSMADEVGTLVAYAPATTYSPVVYRSITVNATTAWTPVSLPVCASWNSPAAP